MLPPISDEVRFIVWIIALICGLISTILLAYSGLYAYYWIRKFLFRETVRGKPPKKPSRTTLAALLVTATISVLGAAFADSAPSAAKMDVPQTPEIAQLPSPTSQPTITNTPTSTLTVTPTQTPAPSATPTPVAMEEFSVEIRDTGIEGKLCGYSKQHSIVRDNTGVIHIFFSKWDTLNLIDETTSNDEGETWSVPDVVAGFEINEEIPVNIACSAAVDGDNNIHLSFNLEASDVAYTRWSSNIGWRAPVIRGQGLPDVGSYAPNIATGLTEQAHIVWSSKRVWYTFFDGLGWSGERDVAPGGWHPDIFIDDAGGRHVVYNGANFIPDKSGNGESSVTVYYVYSDDGLHWGEEIPVKPEDYIWAGAASVKVDHTGRRHVTYIQWAPLEGDLYYTYSDDGEAWALPVRLNTDPGVQTGTTGNESASMLLDPSGNLYVIWKGLGGPEPVTTYIFLRWLNKSTQEWSEVYKISPITPGIGIQPSLPYWVLSESNPLSFVMDMVWGDQGKLWYGRIEFRGKN